MKVRLGISIVSLLRLGLPGPFPRAQTLIDEAREIGWSGVQMLPVRGSTGAETGSIIAFESAWNASTILDFLLRSNGTAGTPAMLHDLLIFPVPSACAWIERRLEEREIRQIQHRFPTEKGGWTIEVNPGLDMTPGKIAENCRRFDCRLVIDTHHLMRGYRPDEIQLRPERAGKKSPLGTTMDEWLEAIEVLAPHTTGFHLNVDKEAYCGGWTDEDTILAAGLKATSKFQKEAFVIVETKPSLKPSESRNWSEKLLRVAKNTIGSIPGVVVDGG